MVDARNFKKEGRLIPVWLNPDLQVKQAGLVLLLVVQICSYMFAVHSLLDCVAIQVELPKSHIVGRCFASPFSPLLVSFSFVSTESNQTCLSTGAPTKDSNSRLIWTIRVTPENYKYLVCYES